MGWNVATARELILIKPTLMSTVESGFVLLLQQLVTLQERSEMLQKQQVQRWVMLTGFGDVAGSDVAGVGDVARDETTFLS